MKHLTLTIASLFLAQPAFALVIDDFSTGPASFVVEPEQFPAPFLQTDLSSNSLLNGTRQIGINGVQGSTGNVVAVVDPADGGSFIYDATGASALPSGVVGLIEALSIGFGDPDWQNTSFEVDLTADGADRIRVEVSDATIVRTFDRSYQPFSVLLASGTPGNRSFQSLGQFDVESDEELQVFELPFNAAQNIDFQRVSYIELFAVNLGSGTTITLDSVTAVPESITTDPNPTKTVPEPTGLLAIVSIGLVALRQRVKSLM